MSRVWSNFVALVREIASERISSERFEARYHTLRVQFRAGAAGVRMQVGE
jgi:hypothetical protein